MQPSNPDKLLRAFVAVARAKSLREAADATSLTQAGLSRQIAALESIVGYPLFHRTGRGMRLCVGAEPLFERLSHAFDDIEHALRDAQAAPGGHVAIATVNTLAAYFVPRLLAELRSAEPTARFSVTLASSSEVVSLVERGVAKFGLVYDLAVDSDQLSITELHSEQLCGYRHIDASGSDVVTVAELREAALILPPRNYALRRIVERECGAEIVAAVESNSVELSLDLASGLWGTAILPHSLGAAAIEHRSLKRVALAGGNFRRQVVAICRKGQANDPACARFMRLSILLSHAET